VEPPRTRPRILGIAMFGVLLASYAINAMDRQLFPLLAPEVRRQYGFSLAGVGFLSTVFTLGMAIAGLPTGYLLVRFSRKTVLQVGIALFSAGTVSSHARVAAAGSNEPGLSAGTIDAGGDDGVFNSSARTPVVTIAQKASGRRIHRFVMRHPYRDCCEKKSMACNRAEAEIRMSR